MGLCNDRVPRERFSKPAVNGPIYGTLPPIWMSTQHFLTLHLEHFAPASNITMGSDSDSDYEKSLKSTRPSTPIETFSIDCLLQSVEEFQRRDQLETIQRLTYDNSLLQYLVVEYQKKWCRTIDLLEKAQEAVLLLQRMLEHCIREDVAAEREWLAFWGIKKEGTQRPNYSPAGWI